jgi:hypothetical protein
MEIHEAFEILDNISGDWKFGKPVRYEAYQTLKAAVLGTTPNTLRDVIAAYIKECDSPLPINSCEDIVPALNTCKQFISKYANIFRRLLHP